MTKKEIEPYLGQFGMLTIQTNGCRAEIHGKPKEIDEEDNLIFKDTHRCVRTFHLNKIKSFLVKEMLPAPTEHNGKPIFWDKDLAGRGYFTQYGKEVDLKR